MNDSTDRRAIDPEEDPYTRDALAAQESVLRRAFENHVFELVKGLTEVSDRLREKYPGVNEWPRVIREVKLEGEYPDTMIRLRTYLKSLDREDWYTEPLWGKPGSFNEEAKRNSAERVAGDILLNASGG